MLILSAKRTLDDRITGLQRGGDDYLTKPFSFAELQAREALAIHPVGEGEITADQQLVIRL